LILCFFSFASSCRIDHSASAGEVDQNLQGQGIKRKSLTVPPQKKKTKSIEPDADPALSLLEERVHKVEERSTSKGAVGYFVPCTRLRQLLVESGVLQQSADEAMIAASMQLAGRR
jgi:hypothetical protein